tara:strand:- start:2384 stop:2761 length:378 start_codon:yes stop_codon:yes gene_type:complete
MPTQNVTVLNPDQSSVIEIDAELANSWLEADEAVLLDVREQEELEMEWIPGATPMPLSKFDAKIVAETVMANAKIVVICFTGRRSIDAAERLIDFGIKEVYSVKDGLLAWNAAGLESIDQSALLI